MSVGVITIDGTKIKANASMDQNRSYSGLVKEILREAEEVDRQEDDSMATIAVMSCPSRCAAQRLVARRSPTRSVAWLSANGARRMTRPRRSRRRWGWIWRLR